MPFPDWNQRITDSLCGISGRVFLFGYFLIKYLGSDHVVISMDCYMEISALRCPFLFMNL